MECAECERLQMRYESLTFAVARVKSALGIAERSYDGDAIERLRGEARDVNEKQQEARAAVARHQQSVHQQGKAALAAGAALAATSLPIPE